MISDIKETKTYFFFRSEQRRPLAAHRAIDDLHVKSSDANPSILC